MAEKPAGGFYASGGLSRYRGGRTLPPLRYNGFFHRIPNSRLPLAMVSSAISSVVIPLI